MAHEAALRCDLAHGIIGYQQETLSALHTPANNVLVRGAPEVVVDDAFYPVQTESHYRGEVGHSYAGMHVGRDMSLDAAQLPRRRVAALRDRRPAKR